MSEYCQRNKTIFVKKGGVCKLSLLTLLCFFHLRFHVCGHDTRVSWPHTCFILFWTFLYILIKRSNFTLKCLFFGGHNLKKNMEINLKKWPSMHEKSWLFINFSPKLHPNALKISTNLVGLIWKKPSICLLLESFCKG